MSPLWHAGYTWPMATGCEAPEWRLEDAPVPYELALAAMHSHAAAIAAGEARERIWLLEHPPVITGGTSAATSELLDPERFPVHLTGRGGRFTYHGPGQRIVYVMLDLGARGRDVRRFVHGLEGWMIAALARLDVPAFRNDAGTGIWVQQEAGIAKVGAIGVRIRRWVSLHGFAVNVATELDHFRAIVPCGIAEHHMARLQDIRQDLSFAALDAALLEEFNNFLSEITDCQAIPAKTLEAESDCS